MEEVVRDGGSRKLPGHPEKRLAGQFQLSLVFPIPRIQVTLRRIEFCVSEVETEAAGKPVSLLRLRRCVRFRV